MKKSLRKTFVTLGTIALLSLTLSSVTSAGPTASYNLDGRTASGSLTYSSSTYSVTSSTRYPVNAGLYAYVSYDSRFGSPTDIFTVSGSNSNSSTLVVKTVSAPNQPAIFIAAYGSHTVSYNGGTWSGLTDL